MYFAQKQNLYRRREHSIQYHGARTTYAHFLSLGHGTRALPMRQNTVNKEARYEADLIHAARSLPLHRRTRVAHARLFVYSRASQVLACELNPCSLNYPSSYMRAYRCSLIHDHLQHHARTFRPRLYEQQQSYPNMSPMHLSVAFFSCRTI